jgi:hypothetical protein
MTLPILIQNKVAPIRGKSGPIRNCGNQNGYVHLALDNQYTARNAFASAECFSETAACSNPTTELLRKEPEHKRQVVQPNKMPSLSISLSAEGLKSSPFTKPDPMVLILVDGTVVSQSVPKKATKAPSWDQDFNVYVSFAGFKTNISAMSGRRRPFNCILLMPKNTRQDLTGGVWAL